jgi:hypothetical protein
MQLGMGFPILITIRRYLSVTTVIDTMDLQNSKTTTRYSQQQELMNKTFHHRGPSLIICCGHALPSREKEETISNGGNRTLGQCGQRQFVAIIHSR